MTGKDQDLRSPVSQPDELAGEQGFLDRWSQRKLETETLAPPPIEALQPAVDTVPVEAPEPPDEQLTDADMPPLESLGEGSDYRGFLSPKVSEALRKAALRKLFRQSRFNVVDGLDDYAEDFTRFEPLGDLVTHEMRRMLERTRKALEESDEVEPSAPPQAVEANTEPAPERAPEAVEPENREQDTAPQGDEFR